MIIENLAATPATITLDITDRDVMTVLRAFLLRILPSGTEVIQGQINRVAEPESTNFVVFTPLMRVRLATNRDSYDDVSFTASISGTAMVVTAVEYGVLRVGALVLSTTPDAVEAGTSITSQGTAAGGVGTYTVSVPQSTASGPLYAGVARSQQDTQLSVQIDVHGDMSGNNMQIISTLFRDGYACEDFAASGMAIQPLYMSEPLQAPFKNGESQIEWRWTADAMIEIRPIVQRPQDFAGAVSVGVSSVD